MKFFNEIESEVSGTIVKVLVDDTPIEFDQPLFLVDPSKKQDMFKKILILQIEERSLKNNSYL